MANNNQFYVGSQEGAVNFNKTLINEERSTPLFHEISPLIRVQGLGWGYAQARPPKLEKNYGDGVPIRERQVASLSSAFFMSTGSSGKARRSWVISSSEWVQ